MSPSHINELGYRLVRITAVVLCCVTCAVGADNIAVAKMVVAKLYPELKGQDLHVAISEGGLLETPGSFSDFTMAIQHPFHEILSKGQCPIPLLSVGFTFSTAGSNERIFHLSAAGPAVNTDRLQQLINEVDSHPEWSDADVLRALAKAGARFGPSAKEELLDELPIEGLKALIGNIKVESVSFKIRDAAQVREHLPSAALLWTIKVLSQSNGQELKYYLLLEPFDGKLVSLGRIPPVP